MKAKHSITLSKENSEFAIKKAQQYFSNNLSGYINYLVSKDYEKYKKKNES
jgi:hypothetical protein